MKCPESLIASMPFDEIKLALPGIPLDEEGPVFQAPWEAQAFAMTLALYEKGLFTWSEWAQSLSLTIRDAQTAGDPDTGQNYYEHWLAALERIVTEKIYWIRYRSVSANMLGRMRQCIRRMDSPLS